MSGKALRTTDYLDHMLDAVRRISFYLDGVDRLAFDADTRTQDAVIRNLEVIGEAARNVQRHDPAFVAAHPELPWALAYRMRNVLSHGYADIDLDVVWSTARNDLPTFEVELTRLRAEIDD
ncbi:MAG TPA: DUF86 domain-containing protein [Acetobacteraceae bacterium]|jgi:uncharacterized protein with HEPN domain